jgi:hypothetical protein
MWLGMTQKLLTWDSFAHSQYWWKSSKAEKMKALQRQQAR